MKILVIGGAGFIGSNLIKELIKNENNIIISLDNYSSGSIKNHIKNVNYIHANTWDILNINIKYFKDFEPDIIYHFGEFSRIHQSFDNINKTYKSNTLGTQQVLEYAIKHKSKLIYSGSSAIFGEEENKNLSPYAFTKFNNIQLIHNYKKWFGLDFCICYFFNVYGEGQIKKGDYATVIGVFEDQYVNKVPFTVVKPGTQTRYFTHVDDIVKGIILVTEKGSGDGYMLGSKEALSINEIFKMFDTQFVYIDERKGERSTPILNSNKEAKLGWKADKKLEDYISEIKNKVK